MTEFFAMLMRWSLVFCCGVFLFLASCTRHTQGPDTFMTGKGKKLVITPIKHASVELNYDGLEFEIDPVSSNVGPIVEYVDKPKADYILVTHSHDDHFEKHAILVLTDGRKTQLLMDVRSWNRYYHRGMPIQNGQKAILGHGITVYAVPAYNVTKRYRKIHPKGVGNGYLIDFDGFRVYIAGDTELIPEMRRLKHIDVAFLPCSTYTMSLPQLRKAVEIIRPRVVYPYHWDETSPEAIKKALRGVPSEVRMRYFK